MCFHTGHGQTISWQQLTGATHLAWQDHFGKELSAIVASLYSYQRILELDKQICGHKSHYWLACFGYLVGHLCRNGTQCTFCGLLDDFRYVGCNVSCIWFFAAFAVELKVRAPTAHTILEIIKVRWGKGPHLVSFMYFLGRTENYVTRFNVVFKRQSLFALARFSTSLPSWPISWWRLNSSMQQYSSLITWQECISLVRSNSLAMMIDF